MFDRIDLPLVIAGFEVQELMIYPASPVTAEEGFVILEKKCSGYIPTILYSIDHDELLRHGPGHSMEKFEFQISLHATHQVSALVKLVKIRPLLFADFRPLGSSEAYALVLNTLTFLAD